MAAAKQISASEKQNITKKLMGILSKRYKGSAPKQNLPILETILFAICLENSTQEQAEEAYQRLQSSFFDLNEIRVSSISELAEAFTGLEQPEWRAMRVRSILHYIFEKHYEFDFESLKRKTLDLASKQLSRIKELSPFVRSYTLQVTLGSHLIPVDDVSCNAAIWLGLVEMGSNVNDASDTLKSAVRKADVPDFCFLFRMMATDPKLRKSFESHKKNAPDEGYPPQTAPARLAELFITGESKSKEPKKAKPTTKKKTTKATKPAGTTGKKKPAKKSAKKSAKKTTPKNKKTPKKKTQKKSTTTKRKTTKKPKKR